MKTVVLACRQSRALSALTDRTCAALLPVAGKPLVEHTIESLAKAGLDDLRVVVSPFAERVEKALGDGARWGTAISYKLARGDESTVEVLMSLGAQLEPPFLVIHGDVLRTPLVSEFLELADEVDGDVVAATMSGVLAGMCLVRCHPAACRDLPSSPEEGGGWNIELPSVELDRGELELIDSIPSYHRANLDALRGRFSGLILPGQELAGGLRIGRLSRVAAGAVKEGPAFVGSHCDVKEKAELRGDVVLSESVVVEARATLKSCVVLPDTLVGEFVDLEDSIVWGNVLISVGTGAVTRVTDSFLLADLQSGGAERFFGSYLDRIAGMLLFALSLPLWPVALVASLIERPSRPFHRVRLRGNQRRLDEDGDLKPVDFIVSEGATRVPALRYLPRLLAVIDGHLRLVGVLPLAPEEADGRTEEWEFLRDDAPCGLVGPAALGISPEAPHDERRLKDAWYAQIRTRGQDVAWLLRGARALFTPRAWWPLPYALVNRRDRARQTSRVDPWIVVRQMDAEAGAGAAPEASGDHEIEAQAPPELELERDREVEVTR